ncbi:hypothetical protein RM780_09810 [Streptomyces sp. DSM 44917]|uniref:Uncharacterized protein n=1 Tax=Streptomyces boetiae TaxID=3075541 RepID=A0ABU2L6Y7_9ACTN|nr:hypothetical protein [Streptomyces sp. DSM 44917]MDT0307257.1 hypothetical protein [Streptomyces sp. DSM 44917]
MPISAPKSDLLTVAELIRLLRTWPGDHVVTLASDPEGNRVSALSRALGDGMYHQDSGPGTALYPMPEELLDDASLRRLFPRGVPEGARAAVVLYPTA